jgi:hypothetical protein
MSLAPGLDHTVAINVLPPDVSTDPDRRARFGREANTVAGLNHAHISCSRSALSPPNPHTPERRTS